HLHDDAASDLYALLLRPPPPPLFPYTTLFRSTHAPGCTVEVRVTGGNVNGSVSAHGEARNDSAFAVRNGPVGSINLFPQLFGYRSEEHTSELQSRSDLVCRLLLEQKKSDTYRC